MAGTLGTVSVEAAIQSRRTDELAGRGYRPTIEGKSALANGGAIRIEESATTMSSMVQRALAPLSEAPGL